MHKAEQLISEIIAAQSASSVETLALKLLDTCQRGSSIDVLQELLTTKNNEAVKAGIWVVSELGQAAAPLLNTIVVLLSHPDKYVRFFAVDSVLSCAGVFDDEAIAEVVGMLEDPEPSIRWKVLDFMTRLSTDQLHAALRWYERVGGDSKHASSLRWLLGPDGAEATAVLSALGGGDSVGKMYAVVAATRMAPFDRDPLLAAATSDEADVKAFALDALSAS